VASALPERYAKAILAAAAELGAGEIVTEELSQLAAALAGDEAARFFFESPGVGRSQRHGAMDEIASRCKLSPVAVSTLHLLVDAGRTDLLGEIAEGLRELADRAAGRVTATVTVAKPSSAAGLKRIAAAIQARIGKQVVVEEEVDPSVVGGVRARAGNLLMDGTVAGRLERLRHSLR